MFPAGPKSATADLPKDSNTMKTTITSIVLALAITSPAAQPSTFPASATPATESAIANWRAKRFGMFIHWGPVSLTGKEIGWSRGKETPIGKYDNLYKEFNPTQFNADKWVAVAKAAGMRYMVLTTKHHDGFCLWDTKLTDYNIMNTPFKRDVVRELAEACKKQGIAFGAYYSTCDWHHPDFPLTSPGGSVRREKSDMDSYNKYLLGQIEELITQYGPLITIWNDVPQEFKGRGVNTINLVRKLQPDILINNRTGDGGDYDTPEQKIGGFNMVRPWESCMTVSAHNHWAWGGSNDGVKPLEACLRMLILGNGGDGNVLLNVGPTPEGVIAPEQANRLKDIGDWLAKYGESLLDTRGGPYKPGTDFACTRKDNSIYLHLLKRSGDTIKLPAIPAKIVSAKLLTGGEVKASQTDKELSLTLAPKDPKEIDVIVKLELDKAAMDIAPIDTTGKP
jgi:alpha-L-fucosidase